MFSPCASGYSLAIHQSCLISVPVFWTLATNIPAPALGFPLSKISTCHCAFKLIKLLVFGRLAETYNLTLSTAVRLKTFAQPNTFLLIRHLYAKKPCTCILLFYKIESSGNDLMFLSNKKKILGPSNPEKASRVRTFSPSDIRAVCSCRARRCCRSVSLFLFSFIFCFFPLEVPPCLSPLSAHGLLLAPQLPEEAVLSSLCVCVSVLSL